MAEKDRISNPSMGSEDLGEEETETRSSGISSGTDTQTHLAALSAQKKKEKDKAALKAHDEVDSAVKKNEAENNEII